MYSKSDNIDVMKGDEVDGIIEDLYDSLYKDTKKNLEASLTWSEFAFDCVDSLYYKLHKIILNRGWSYADSPKWLQNKKAAINLKNNDDKCLQYAIIFALNYEQIKSHPEKIPNIKPFIDQCDWK